MAGFNGDVLSMRQDIMKGLRAEFNRQEIRDKTSMELSQQTIMYLRRLNGGNNGSETNIISKLTDEFEDYADLEKRYGIITEKWQKKSLQVWEDILEVLKNCKCCNESCGGGSGGGMGLKGLEIVAAITGLEVALSAVTSSVKSFETTVENLLSKIPGMSSAPGNPPVPVPGAPPVPPKVPAGKKSIWGDFVNFFNGNTVNPNAPGSDSVALPHGSPNHAIATPSNSSKGKSSGIGKYLEEGAIAVGSAIVGGLVQTLAPEMTMPGLRGGLSNGEGSDDFYPSSGPAGLPYNKTAFNTGGSSASIDTLYVNSIVASNGSSFGSTMSPTAQSMIKYASYNDGDSSDYGTSSPAATSALDSLVSLLTNNPIAQGVLSAINSFLGLGSGQSIGPTAPSTDDGSSSPAIPVTAGANSVLQAIGKNADYQNQDLMSSIAYSESTLNPNQGNDNSSARGAFQILNKGKKSTAKQWIKKYGGPLGITDKNYNPDNTNQQAALVNAWINDQRKSNTANSIANTPGNIYGEYVMGNSLLETADSSAIAASVEPSAARSNHDLFYNKDNQPYTVGQLQDILQKKATSVGFATALAQNGYNRSKATTQGTNYTPSDASNPGAKPSTVSSNERFIGAGVTNSQPSIDDIYMLNPDMAMHMANSAMGVG